MNDWKTEAYGLPWPVFDPESCSVCGDNPAYLVIWQSQHEQGIKPHQRLCAECIEIQNSMYGTPKERLIKS